MVAAHHSVAGKSGLPYTPIYGVYSDGVAYAVLPHVHETQGRAKVICTFQPVPGFTFNDIEKKNLWGCTTSDSYAILTQYNGGGGSQWSWQLYSYTGMVMVEHSLTTASVPHTAVCIRDGNSLSLDLDGQTRSTTTGNGTITLGRMGIFTQNNYGSGDGVSPMPNRVPQKIAICAYKYWDGDTLCADLVPCIDKKTDEVCFYNLVDGQFVKNLAGSGGFIAFDGETT